MIKAYSYIFLIYPLMLLFISMKDKLLVKFNKLNNILFVMAIGAFYTIYASPIMTRVDNSFLASLTAVLIYFSFRKEMNVRDVFENYTIYWLAIFSIWSLISFPELLLLSGSLILMRSSESLKTAFIGPALWLVLIFMNTFIQDLDLVESSALRHWFLECFYLIFFFLFFPKSNSRLNTLTMVVFLVFSNKLIFENFSVMPTYFRYIILGLQAALLFAKNKEFSSLPLSFSIFFIVALPDMGLMKELLTLVFLYIGVFNERYLISDKLYRPLLVLNGCVFIYLVSLFMSVLQGGTVMLKVSCLLLILSMINDFVQRTKTLGQLSFEKSIPTT